MKKCVNKRCGKEFDAAFKFCPFCGKPQTETVQKRTRRGNGQGSVYKSPCGTYTAEITKGYIIHGSGVKRKMKRKKGFKTKREALAWIEDYNRGIIPVDTVTINTLWETFKKSNEELSKSKKTAYKIAYNKICGEVEHRKIDSFTVAELQDIVNEFGSSYYTKRDIKNLLSHFYKIALQDDFVTSNKAQYIKLPKHESAERVIFSDEDLRKLWKDFNSKPSKVCAGMLLMCYTGMRPGELLGVLSENVLPNQHYMTGGIKTEKGKKRKIIIPQKADSVVRWLLSFKEEKLCYYPYKNLFYDEWQEKRAELKLSEELTPYSCRHTYITRLTRLQASPAMLQELAGHEDYETTLTYTHLSVNDRFEFVNLL